MIKLQILKVRLLINTLLSQQEGKSITGFLYASIDTIAASVRTVSTDTTWPSI
jgi:hypothetical protein